MVEQFNKFNDAANRMHLGVASLSEAINEGAKLGIAMGKNEIVASVIANMVDGECLNTPDMGINALKEMYTYTEQKGMVR